MVSKVARRHQFHQLDPRRVRGTTDERKTLSIPAKDKPESKRYNEKALKIRLQVTRCIGIGTKQLEIILMDTR